MLVEKTIVDGVCRLTLNRPEQHNTINRAMLEELSAALVKIEREAKIIVLAGNGSSFCAGADMKELFDASGRQLASFSVLGKKVCAQLEALTIPTIAVLQGHTLGEGIELALSCDIRVASDKTTFEFPQVKMGYAPGFGGTKKLPALIGKARALELLITGLAFDTRSAIMLGLINQSVHHKQLDKRVDDLVKLLMSYDSLAVSAIKHLVNSGEFIKETAYFSEQASTPEAKLKIKESLGE